MLGSVSEADDAVQESWIRFSRADTTAVDNLSGWLTTVTARICLDMLRSRRARREDATQPEALEPFATTEPALGPEDAVVLADSVGPALLIVLDALSPAERIAFVLHDVFGMSFDEIAPIVARTPTATRQLASRARRRVRGVESVPDAESVREQEVVRAFLAAARSGDFDALLALLDPDVVFRHDPVATPDGAEPEVHGAHAVAGQFSGRAKVTRPALIDGAIGVAIGPRGRPAMVMAVTIADGRISELQVIADPDQVGALEIEELDS